MPDVYIIAGPNGAGKTAYVRDYLPTELRCREFVNADLIAAGLSPFAPDRALFAAGRIMLRRMRELVSRRVDFCFETTLAGLTYRRELEEMKAAGYSVRLDYLWVPDFEIARRRVAQRVRKGGHDIPELVQARRFAKALQALLRHYRPVLDAWRFYDNTGPKPILVFEEQGGVQRTVEAVRLAMIGAQAGVQILSRASEDRVEEPAVVLAGSEAQASLRAMRRAYARVVLENLSWGLPVVQWRPGRGTVEVPAEQLAPLARRIMETNGEPLSDGEERELLSSLEI